MSGRRGKFRIALIMLLTLALLICALIAGAELFLLSKSSEAVPQGNFGGKETSELWYYDALNLGEAKAKIASLDKSKLEKPIIVAVVDTGIDASHELFSGVLLTDEQGNVAGYNSYTGSTKSDLSDASSDKHGNGVAGIIAMFIKEFDLQNYIKIMPIKANTTNKSSFAIESVTRAITYASEHGADVINLSLGLLASDMRSTDWVNDTKLRYAVESASRTSLIVAAAGNNGLSSARAENTFYPAAMDGVFGVMNMSEDGGVYSTSNYGSAYDMASPGQGIYTASSASGNTYRLMNGTSASTPIASFAAALLKLRRTSEGASGVGGRELGRMMSNLESEKINYKNETISLLDFGAIAGQDFDNTVYEFETPTGLELSHDGTFGSGDFKNVVYMRANKVQKINLIAKILPYGETDPDYDELVDWTLVDEEGNETELSQGVEFCYDPQKFGSTRLVASLSVGNVTFEEELPIFIEYLNYLVGDVRVTYLKNADNSARVAPTSGRLYTQETTTFTLTGLKYLAPLMVKWYVNGEYRASGPTFDFKPEKPGDYLISAQYGDNPRIDYKDYAFSAHVVSFILRPLDLSMLIVFILIFASAVAAVVVISKRKKRESQTTSKN